MNVEFILRVSQRHYYVLCPVVFCSLSYCVNMNFSVIPYLFLVQQGALGLCFVFRQFYYEY